MTQPIPLRNPRNPFLSAKRPEESQADRRARQLQVFRDLTELNMIAARAAAKIIEAPAPATEQQAAVQAATEPQAAVQAATGQQAETEQAAVKSQAILALSRATRAVTLVIAAENRVASGEFGRPIAFDDPRRVLLRQALHPLVAGETRPVRRKVLENQLDEAIDECLLADLDRDLELAHIAIIIAENAGLKLDLAKVTDELLEMEERKPSSLYQPFPPGSIHGKSDSS